MAIMLQAYAESRNLSYIVVVDLVVLVYYEQPILMGRQ